MDSTLVVVALIHTEPGFVWLFCHRFRLLEEELWNPKTCLNRLEIFLSNRPTLFGNNESIFTYGCKFNVKWIFIYNIDCNIIIYNIYVYIIFSSISSPHVALYGPIRWQWWSWWLILYRYQIWSYHYFFQMRRWFLSYYLMLSVWKRSSTQMDDVSWLN